MTASQLIHGVFNPATFLQQFWSEQLAARDRSLDNLTWRTSQQHPEYTDDPDTAVVLSPFLSTVQETFDWYESIAFVQHHNSYHWPLFKTDAKHLRMANNISFQPNSIGWDRIKLNANYRHSPRNVRKAGDRLPGLEVFAALAGHPKRVGQMNGTAQRPYLWMAGLEVTFPGDGPWMRVPDTWFSAFNSQFKLDADWDHREFSVMAVPVFGGSITQYLNP